ncbi:hypothetical protein E4O00_11470 [Treponema sp. OMZ 788]|uniref:hypothetical protein n=1 Tax=Treponema TaxID=157 RepID=UPI0020A5E7FB|nr:MULTISPECIES: hypothetical protein [Treponema]UTC56240.1 hypothetical protein E4N69_03940 [Treponema sp. OMZ 906]UTC64405.1 hypothetical protein E4O00_11470 [Treponema sp. OMZ 788]UYT07490.1 hypothetical protein OE909_11055 [Treponema denticola]
MNKYSRILNKEVRIYKEWVYKHYSEMTEDTDNGEFLGPSFDRMRESAISFVKNVEVKDVTETDLESILYCVARDNECEYLADFISSYKEWFKYLIERCIDSIYTTAKWQLVKRLPVYKDDSSVTDWVFKYINVDDEYTQRMSLSALSEIDYKKAEQYAIEFWERDKYKGDTYAEEYQKIMALSVLYKIKSDKLSEYIEAARQLDFVYLKENADEIANSD